MTDDQHQRPQPALQLAEQGLRRRPRRDPAAAAPPLAEADKPSPAELARQRAQLTPRRRPRPQGE